MPFLTDTFTDTEGTTLASHTGELGATWAKVTGVTGNAEIATNRVRGSSSTTAEYYASGTPATAEYDVEAVFRRLTDLGNVRVYGRLSTGADTGYGVRYNGGATNAWELHKVEAGVTTLLGSWSETFNNGEERTVKLEIRNAAKKVYIDGVERISSANNDITAAGRVGMRFFASSSPADSTAYHIASITASDPVAAPPVNTVAPAVTGTPTTGLALSCSTGTWTGDATITYTYQWQRAGVSIVGATSSTYLLDVVDEGLLIRCDVTATNENGSGGPVQSNAVTPTAPAGVAATCFLKWGGARVDCVAHVKFDGVLYPPL
jgi:hypothetical protein